MNESLITAASHALDQQMALAETLARSGLMPAALRGKPADVLIVMMTGQELGLGPMLALRSIYVVDGKPTLSADLAAALILRSTACGEFRCVESTDQHAVVVARRRDQTEATRIDYSIADAKLAGLAAKQNWQRHPKAMLRARAILAAGRLVFPDLLAGVYDPDELDHSAPVTPIRATVVSEPVPPGGPGREMERIYEPEPEPVPPTDPIEKLRASMLATSTVADLQAWSAKHAKEPKARKVAIKADYEKHMERLREDQEQTRTEADIAIAAHRVDMDEGRES